LTRPADPAEPSRPHHRRRILLWTAAALGITVALAAALTIPKLADEPEEKQASVAMATPADTFAARSPGPGSFEETQGEPPVPYVAGKVLVVPGRGRFELAAQASGSMMPLGAPTVIFSPDEEMLLYPTSSFYDVSPSPTRCDVPTGCDGPGEPVAHTPSLRLFDLSANRDTLFEDGARSAAWRRDGAIAYVKGIHREIDPEPSPGEPAYPGHVYVRNGPSGPPVRWTTRADEYTVIAWAGDSLVVLLPKGTSQTLLVLDGPGRQRTLGEWEFPMGISPDGRTILLLAGAALDTPSVKLVLKRVADGGVEASVDLAMLAEKHHQYLLHSFMAGSWVGERAALGNGDGIGVFRTSGGTIELEKALAFDPGQMSDLLEMGLSGDLRTVAFAGFSPAGPGAPEFASGAQRLGWCEIKTSRCKARTLSRGQGWVYFPANISRPV